MKKSKLLVAALTLLSPLTSCNNQETSSASSAPADLVLNENQGVRIIRDASYSLNGLSWIYDYSTYFDANFSLTHQIGDKIVLDYPYKYTTITIEMPRTFTSDSFSNYVERPIGTLYEGILKIEFNFSDAIWDYCGYSKDKNGEWIAGPSELLTSCYPNDDGTYINNPSLYENIEVASGGAGYNYDYPDFFFEVYDL